MLSVAPGDLPLLPLPSLKGEVHLVSQEGLLLTTSPLLLALHSPLLAPLLTSPTSISVAAPAPALLLLLELLGGGEVRGGARALGQVRAAASTLGIQLPEVEPWGGGRVGPKAPRKAKEKEGKVAPGMKRKRGRPPKPNVKSLKIIRTDKETFSSCTKTTEYNRAKAFEKPLSETFIHATQLEEHTDYIPKENQNNETKPTLLLSEFICNFCCTAFKDKGNLNYHRVTEQCL